MSEVGSVGEASVPAAGRPGTRGRLVRRSRPTRGHVVAALVTAVVVVVGGVGWQVWGLATAGSRAPGAVGWSVASMVVLLVAGVVMVDGARREQAPMRATSWWDGAARRPREQRRAVRRAVSRGELPDDPQVWASAGEALSRRLGGAPLAWFWLVFGGIQLGLTAGQGDRGDAGLFGSVWVAIGVAELVALAWWRRNADRLDAAWRDARATAVPPPANARTDQPR